MMATVFPIMLDEERIVALIPARGGSKSIPGKNIREIAGKPLIAWSIETAQEAGSIDRTIVSTDSKKIADVAREFGAEVIDRPAKYATDDSLVIDTVRHTKAALERENEPASYMILLEPTSPLRTVEDVEKSVSRLLTDELDSVSTFCEAELNPHRTWKLENGTPTPFVDGANPWLPRQKLPHAYQLTGAVYTFNLRTIHKTEQALLYGDTGAVEMPAERAVDIDTKKEFKLAEMLLQERL
jgi:CMP-N-acetylneuraminic acid synthetase